MKEDKLKKAKEKIEKLPEGELKKSLKKNLEQKQQKDVLK